MTIITSLQGHEIQSEVVTINFIIKVIKYSGLSLVCIFQMAIIMR